ncbi:MAG: hypothetical protein JXA89_14895 [Anaerolineae bacterium]|nr:hypothetical protein [Anaerolineae bacterium]
MEKQPLVVLLGDSVLIDGVAAGLVGGQVPDMVRINTLTADIVERLKSLQPDLIVFELDAPRSSSIFALLREQPGILLLGLDLDYSQVLVLNSQQHITQTMSDLYQIVQTQANEQARLSKGGGSAEQDERKPLTESVSNGFSNEQTTFRVHFS